MEKINQNYLNMDFNLEQYMLETRCCGTLTKPWSAIAIEEEVTN